MDRSRRLKKLAQVTGRNGRFFFFLSFSLHSNFVHGKVMLGRNFFVGYNFSRTNLDFTAKLQKQTNDFRVFSFCGMRFFGWEASTQQLVKSSEVK